MSCRDMIEAVLSRLKDYTSDIQDVINRLDSISVVYFFRGVSAVAELNTCIRNIISDRQYRLGDYFGGISLIHCLRLIAKIEDMVKTVKDESDDLKNFINYHATHPRGEQLSETYLKMLQLAIGKQMDMEIPDITYTIIWKGPRDGELKPKYKLKNVFLGAYEDFLEKARNTHFDSKDEENDNPYLQKIDENELGNKHALEPYDLTVYPDLNQSKIFEQIEKDLQENTDTFILTIFSEISRALALLENSLKVDAEDIYRIRTNCLDNLQKKIQKDLLNDWYTKIPLAEYYMAREEWREELAEDYRSIWSQWRLCNKLWDKPEKNEERKEFYLNRADEIIKKMESYPELWSIKMRSGGLDKEETPEDIARMFYRRGETVRYFLRLQWEYEYIKEQMKKMMKEGQCGNKYSETESKKKAVDSFVEQLFMLVEVLYDKYNGHHVSLGSNKKNAYIEIDKIKIKESLNDKVQFEFEVLSELCYSVGNQYNKNFISIIKEWRDAKYFKELPNKHIADAASKIINASSGYIETLLGK